MFFGEAWDTIVGYFAFETQLFLGHIYFMLTACMGGPPPEGNEHHVIYLHLLQGCSANRFVGLLRNHVLEIWGGHLTISALLLRSSASLSLLLFRANNLTESPPYPSSVSSSLLRPTFASSRCLSLTPSLVHFPWLDKRFFLIVETLWKLNKNKNLNSLNTKQQCLTLFSNHWLQEDLTQRTDNGEFSWFYHLKN